MIQTQKGKQETRSALKAVISNSKRTTMVSSCSPPPGHPSPHTESLSSSNGPGGGRGTASPGLTNGEHWWQDDGKLEGSFVACLASPLAGHWLNQGPGARPSAGAAVGRIPCEFGWVSEEGRLESACHLFTESTVILQVPRRTIFPSSLTDVTNLPRISILLVLLSFWISIIRSLSDAERKCVKVTGITKRYSFVEAFHLTFFASTTAHVQDLLQKMSSLSAIKFKNSG